MAEQFGRQRGHFFLTLPHRRNGNRLRNCQICPHSLLACFPVSAPSQKPMPVFIAQSRALFTGRSRTRNLPLWAFNCVLSPESTIKYSAQFTLVVYALMESDGKKGKKWEHGSVTHQRCDCAISLKMLAW